MESSRHSHKKKRSHGHHSKRLAVAEKPDISSPLQKQDFGKEIESGRDSELRKYAQNVLGKYDDYRSAMSKVHNMSEQMYGVAELAPSQELKPGQVLPTSELKKRKKQHHDSKFEVSHSAPADPSGKKKASVAPYMASDLATSTEHSIDTTHYSLEKKHSSILLPSSSHQFPSTATVCTTTGHSTALASNLTTAIMAPPTKEKKSKKPKKRRSSHVYESLVDSNITNVSVDPVSKSRPEALHLPSANTGVSPGPDTGDVRHMLQELLHPPSVSLVTPIPTPNKVKPFVFPNNRVFKTPSSSELTHTTPSLPFLKSSSCDNSTCTNPLPVASEGGEDQLSSSSSSSSCSSSASSPSSSQSSSPSVSSTASSPFSADPYAGLGGSLGQEERGPRLTLEQLQQHIASSKMVAITPLKKTPPHFIREELANLSPAKPYQPTLLAQSDLALSSLASQSSLGFQPLPTQLGSSQSNNTDSSDSSEDSDSSAEGLDSSHLHVVSTLLSNPEKQLPVQFITAQQQESLPLPKAHRKRQKDGHADISSTRTKKHKTGAHYSTQSSSQEPSYKQREMECTTDTAAGLLVKIPLADLRLPKPKATVEPYNIRVTAPTSSTPQRRNTADTLTESDEIVPGRDRYSRFQNVDYSTGLVHDVHGSGRAPGERARVHGGGRWERERTGVPRLSGRTHGWERDHYHRGGEDYWSDTSHHESSRDTPRGSSGARNFPRKRDPEYFMQEARRRKKEADKIMVPGLEKAKLYMESVTYFMRHGGAIETEQQSSAANPAVKRNPYKMYSDTVSMIKYCQNMAGECKPLLVLCLRCQSALYWRMFLIKQLATAHVQKELQEFFIPPKSGQSKSPFLGGLSPLPSPASVGSTASTSSAGATSSLADSTVALPRHTYNKTAEHLAVCALVYTCLDLWRLSDSYMQQCREFFLNADRKAGLTIHYYSPVFQVASWVENILKSF